MNINGARVARWLVAGGTILVVVIVALWDSSERVSPGPLHASHAAVLELAGSDGCAECHGEKDESMSTACMSCHELIVAQMRAGSGLHGALAEAVVDDCGDCHFEHSNGAVALVSEHAFLRADAGDPRFYDHHHIPDYALDGVHALIECSDCHESADAAFLRKGQRRFNGLTTACMSCHEDVHAGEFGADCASCHGQDRPFDLVAEFDHDARFPLVGGHQQACTACHEPHTAFGVATLQAEPPERYRTCGECHESPHGEAMTRLFGTPEDCADCHAPVTESFVGDAAGMTMAAHAAIGFPLADAHADVQCQDCHGAPDFAFSERYPGRRLDDCAACHEDPHDRQFDLGPTRGRCAACHSGSHFTPSRFDVDDHAATDFPLEDAHLEVACADCHEAGADDEIVRYAETPTECAACHEDPHVGQFDGGATRGDCASCHGGVQFTPSAFDLEHHEDTIFPLHGGHEAVGCDRCHPRVTREGREFTQFVPTATACAECHEDAHDGLFDQPELPRDVGGREGCTRCHSADEPRFAGVHFDAGEHELWTEYPLIGAHVEAECTGCHKPGNDPDPRRRSFGRASRVCADCHDDSHGSQFEIDGVTDCARCHDPHAFKIAEFDHDGTAFPLDETHRVVACDRCHRADRRGIVRYRPLGTECQDCHGFK